MPAPRRRVLPEEAYVAAVAAIIRRDFFPDSRRLQAQQEYLDALEAGDDGRLRACCERYSASPSPAPSTPGASATAPDELPEGVDTGLTLDEFVRKYTSEDNASFSRLMQRAQKRLLERRPWLFREHERLAITDTESSSVEAWRFRPKNALMHYPEEAPLTPAETAARAADKRGISHANTRLPAAEACAVETRGRGVAGAAATPRVAVGEDGSPQVNGYGFLTTPRLEPGKDVEPLMTWGHVDGTPFRLDAGDTPVTKGPAFTMQEPSVREQLAAELARKSHKRVRSAGSSMPVSRRRRRDPAASNADRLAGMSPAAQRLGSSLAAGRSSLRTALRTPRRRSGRALTPQNTPRRPPSVIDA